MPTPELGWTPTAVATRAAVAAARVGLPEPQLMRLFSDGLYRAGDVVLRVSRPGSSTAHLRAVIVELLSAGVPVAAPARIDPMIVDGCEVSFWQWVEVTTAPTPTAMGSLAKRLHQAPLPEAPLPRLADTLGNTLDRLMGTVGDEHLVAEPAALVAIRRAQRNADDITLPRLAAHSDVVVVHGDLHAGNVLVGRDGPLLADLAHVSAGPPIWDHVPLLARTQRFGTPQADYGPFAEAYGHDYAAAAAEDGLIELQLLLATAWALVVGRRDAELRGEAQTRLRWWSGDRDAPQWRAF